MEWTSTAIRIWFFPRNEIPTDIMKASDTIRPNPNTWRRPDANFQGSCDFDAHFTAQQLVFNTDFCGSFAGNAFVKDGCPKIDPVNVRPSFGCRYAVSLTLRRTGHHATSSSHRIHSCTAKPTGKSTTSTSISLEPERPLRLQVNCRPLSRRLAPALSSRCQAMLRGDLPHPRCHSRSPLLPHRASRHLQMGPLLLLARPMHLESLW